MSVPTLLVGIDMLGAILLEATYNGKSPLASVLFGTERKEKIAYSNETKPACDFFEVDETTIVAICKSIEPSQAPHLVRLLLKHFQADRVIIFESFTTREYSSPSENLVPPFLRCLRTSTAEQLDGTPDLEVSNMLSGLSAAILVALEIRQKKAWVYKSLLEMQLGRYDVTLDTLEAYEPLFRTLANKSIISAPKSKAQYQPLLNIHQKKDTNHMYM
ncbi:hypothetical protein DFS34DRAFT_602012 [Phlyctochytrium arcticum]|nr:hypothetical protein DFS34DRAFT_602012 [Phlyctochytrium arcticum]